MTTTRPAQSPVPSPAPPRPQTSAEVVPPRRPAWQEGLDRLRAAAVTEPGRLRIIGAVLALLVLLFGVLADWQVSNRQDAADAVLHRSQPLSADVATIYRSLADADTTAASGFLIGGQEPKDVRHRYDTDIATASGRLARAAATTGSSTSAGQQIERLNRQLPVYTSLVEAARANNRQGLPLGGAYLRAANDMMSDQLLPAASKLYEAETGRLSDDYDHATTWPWAALGAGVLALAALGWAQRREFLRTNRVFSHGLLASTAAAVVVMLWLVVGHGVARWELNESNHHGAMSLKVLNEARISALQARADENLTLVARGAVTVTHGPHKDQDAYEVGYGEQMRSLVGGDGSAPSAKSSKSSKDSKGGAAVAPAAHDSLLAQAQRLADNAGGRSPVDHALTYVRQWQQRHHVARADDDKGDYGNAVEDVIGGHDSANVSFDQVDHALQQALTHEQSEFEASAHDGRDALDGLAIGAAVLAVMGAAGAVLGIGRRLSEYR